MAGHRRGAGRPLRPAERAQNRRAALAGRLAKAGTPSARIGIAADHLRATLAVLPAGQAERYAVAAVQYLTGLADQAAKSITQ